MEIRIYTNYYHYYLSVENITETSQSVFLLSKRAKILSYIMQLQAKIFLSSPREITTCYILYGRSVLLLTPFHLYNIT